MCPALALSFGKLSFERVPRVLRERLSENRMFDTGANDAVWRADHGGVPIHSRFGGVALLMVRQGQIVLADRRIEFRATLFQYLEVV